MKVLTIAGVSILALGLILGIALPGLAAPDVAATPWADDCQTSMVRGKVLSVDEGEQEFVIQSGEQEPTISVDGNTKYFKLCLPGRIIALARHRMEFRHQNQEEAGALGWNQMRWRHQNLILQPDSGDLPEPKPPKLKWLRPFGEGAEFSDIDVGDRVVVWLADGENSYLAKRVLIIEPSVWGRTAGTIKRLSDDHIVIEPVNGGDTVPLRYDESTTFILKGFTSVEVGQFARAVYNTETTMAKVVWVWSEAPELGD